MNCAIELAALRREPNVPIVEADDLVTPRGKHAAKVVIPSNHLRSKTHDEQQRRRIGVSESVVDQFDPVGLRDGWLTVTDVLNHVRSWPANPSVDRTTLLARRPWITAVLQRAPRGILSLWLPTDAASRCLTLSTPSMKDELSLIIVAPSHENQTR
jgi:hypothetical protein